MTTALEHHLQRQVEHSRDFFWHRVRWKAVREQLPRDRPFTLLDVGAGVGLLGDYLAEVPGGTYRFTEPIPELEARLEARWGKDANLRDREAYDGVDVVTLLDVAEHIEDDHAFLGDLAAKMPAGATLVMTVPAMASLWSYWDEALDHYRRYDKAMLRALLAPLPLEVREVSYLFPEMVPAALLRRRRTRTPSTDAAEFPDLPRPVNRAFERLGTATLRLRRAWPVGTSALVVAVRR
jgi:hypothetical protein